MKNPSNSIHVSIPQTQRAALNKMLEWKQQQVIVQDEYAAIYVLYQYFRLPNDEKMYVRKGFMTLVRLKEGEEK